MRVFAPASYNSIVASRITIGDYWTEFKVGTEPGLSSAVGGAPLVVLRSYGDQPIAGPQIVELTPALLHSIATNLSGSNAKVMARGPDGGNPYWDFGFQFPSGQAPSVGTFQWMDVSKISGASPACQSTPDARSKFQVKEVSASGTIINSLAIDFEYYCDSPSDVLMGFIRINSAVPIIMPADTFPAPFSIAAKVGVGRGIAIISDPVLVSGFDSGVPISIVGGEYSIGAGPFTSAPGTLSPGQTVRVRVTSSAAFSTQTSAVLSVGDKSATFAVTTTYLDNYPDALYFPDKINVRPNTYVLSDVLTIDSINVPVNVFLDAPGVGEFSIGGRPFTTQFSQLQPGETLQLRLLSSNLYSMSTAMQVRVGTAYAVFNVATGQQAYSLNLKVHGSGSVTMSPPGIECTSLCSASIDWNAMVTLTANPSPGNAFVGWSGDACAGTGPCTITITGGLSVHATFVSQIPSAPAIAQTFNGAGSVVFKLTPPAYTGGLPITQYQVSCNSGALSGSSPTGLLTLGGFTTAGSYTCSATATNSAGTSPPSASMVVTYSENLATQLTGISSRQTHGNVGDFDLALPIGAAIGGPIIIEPRSLVAGAMIVFSFDVPVVSGSGASATDESGNPVSVQSTVAVGNEYRVRLAPLPDKKRVSVSVTGINGTTDATTALGLLVGDVNGSAGVSPIDALQIKGRSGHAVSRENFHYDINLSGVIGAADVTAAKRRAGNSLP